jgi:hypothetical protein
MFFFSKCQELFAHRHVNNSAGDFSLYVGVVEKMLLEIGNNMDTFERKYYVRTMAFNL